MEGKPGYSSDGGGAAKPGQGEGDAGKSEAGCPGHRIIVVKYSWALQGSRCYFRTVRAGGVCEPQEEA